MRLHFLKLVLIHVRITKFRIQYVLTMPVIKSAIKKLRQDRKREKQNDELRAALKTALRSAKKTKSGKSVALAFSTVDKAAKNNIIHVNKASRLKASLSKVAKPISAKGSVKPKVKKTIVKSKSTAPKKKSTPKK